MHQNLLRQGLSLVEMVFRFLYRPIKVYFHNVQKLCIANEILLIKRALFTTDSDSKIVISIARVGKTSISLRFVNGVFNKD